MQNIYAQDQKNVMSYVWKQCVLVKSSNIMKHFLRIIEDGGTNESIEDFDYPVTHLLPLDFCYLHNGNLKRNLLSNSHYEKNEYKAYQVYYLYECSRMSIEILAHILSLF